MATRAVRPARKLGWGNILVAAAATTLITFTLMALSFGLSPGAGSGPEERTVLTFALMVHVGTVLPALALGAYVLIGRKGGRLHRLLGRIWAGLMVTTAISSFWLGGEELSFIHLFSVATLISVPLAVFWIRRGDVERHQRTMAYLYVGLVVAGLFAFTPGRLFATWLFG